MGAKYPTPADAEIKASILSKLKVHEGGWYRDKQDILWLDAEPIPGTDNFILYRSGSGPRIYTPDGKCLKDGDDLTPHTGTHLAYEIDREGPIAPLST